jgi:hypothetical protein
MQVGAALRYFCRPAHISSTGAWRSPTRRTCRVCLRYLRRPDACSTAAAFFRALAVLHGSKNTATGGGALIGCAPGGNSKGGCSELRHAPDKICAMWEGRKGPPGRGKLGLDGLPPQTSTECAPPPGRMCAVWGGRTGRLVGGEERPRRATPRPRQDVCRAEGGRTGGLGGGNAGIDKRSLIF